MSASVVQENSMNALEKAQSSPETSKPLPDGFRLIHPCLHADQALDRFRLYLGLMLKDPDSPLRSESSVATYASCATCWIRRYARGVELQYALSKEFIASTAKEDTVKAIFARSIAQTRCGLNHLVRMYEQCCKQFHPSIKAEDIFKPKSYESKKRKRVVLENTPTLHHEFVEELAEEFIHRFRASSEGFPTTVVGMKQFLRLFVQFKDERLTEKVWELCGVSKEVLLTNTVEVDV